MSNNVRMTSASRKKRLLPYPDERPSKYAERLGEYYSSMVNDNHKKDLGQFFTPMAVAKFMASFSYLNKSKIKILDPGCGLGILSTCVAEAVVDNAWGVHTIELVAFETDVNILPLVDQSLKYLALWLNERGIEFTYFLCKNDFILHNSHVLTNQESTHELYDIVISNPPYFKLPKNDERALAAKTVIFGQTNIYTIFLLIAAKLLENTGALIFITPRSFCSGNYFRLFREIFFSIVNLKLIHLFVSRKDAFKKDGVLQENIIIVASKRMYFEPNQIQIPFAKESKVTISSSRGIEDLAERRIKEYEWKKLINLNSYQKILHLPSSDIDEQVIDIFKTWTGSLSSYNLEISTGPVVDFRSENMITNKRQRNSVPLIWLTNVESMKVTWPRQNGHKGKPKGQFIVYNKDSLSRLIPNKNYVLLRRFSAKDDNRRLIAAPYFSSQFNGDKIGVENHLNYIYHKEIGLTETEVIGLSSLLNSKLFDIYFRTFNGNINVSATELRDFPLPDFRLIQCLGESLNKRKPSTEINDIDTLVAEVFDLKIDLSRIYG